MRVSLERKTPLFRMNVIDDVVEAFGLERFEFDFYDDKCVLLTNGIEWKDRDALALALLKKAIPKSKWAYESGKFQNTNSFQEVETGGKVKKLWVTKLVFRAKSKE